MSGRPTLYTAEIADRILYELSGGRTLRDVCRDDGLPPHNTVRGWVVDDRDGFAARYRRAREVGYDAMADDILEIADDGRHDWIVRQDGSNTEPAVDHEHIKRSQIRIKARQWLLSKTMPKHYGDRPDPNVGHAPDDGWAALLKAVDGKTRGLPGARRQQLPPPQQDDDKVE